MRPLACWIGRHEWTSRVEQGETYKACARCGKEPRRGRGIASREEQELQDSEGIGTGTAGGFGP
jgi:hypothetical protein